MFHVVGETSTIYIRNTTIQFNEEMAKTGSGTILDSSSLWRSETNFIIDVLYTQHSIGCDAHPIDFRDGYSRFEIIFDDDNDHSFDFVKELQNIAMTIKYLRIFQFILAISLLSYDSFDFVF